MAGCWTIPREKRGENRWRLLDFGCKEPLVWSRVCHRSNRTRDPDKGFALVVCLMLMLLIGLLAMGLASLAAIELRTSSKGEHAAIARANARVALMQAIGQLQKSLGPDQRVSATAEILDGSPAQPHWTGVWRSTREDGSPLFDRDDLAGGLRDSRIDQKGGAAERVLEWLVSGERADPLSGPGALSAVMAAGDEGKPVAVAKIPVQGTSGTLAGHQAWWTADLGVRANIRTRDPRADLKPSREDPSNGAWFRLLASQAADPSMMEGGVTFEPDELDRLFSADSAALTQAGSQWREDRALDFTVDSLGVLADVMRGGLKQDLTAFFLSDGEIPAADGLAGLKDSDPLAGDPTGARPGSMRHRLASPRFGLLRDWAGVSLPFTRATTPSLLAEHDDPARAKDISRALALANEQPVKLAGNQRASLQPILVEASNFIQVSSFRTEGFDPPKYQLRHHHYPRVVLWNPYNIDLDFERAIIMIQGNGRHEMWTDNSHFNKDGNLMYNTRSQWLSFEGGRSTQFSYEGSVLNLLNTEGYNDPYMGSYYFAIPRTRFAPGECLVFSPAKSAEYDCLSPYRPGPYNLNANELSCTVPPDPSRSYYVSGTDIGGGQSFLTTAFWFAPTSFWSNNGSGKGVENQNDDTRAVLKHVGDMRTVTFDPKDELGNFDRLPQIAVVSASLQYGAGREPRVSWSSTRKMPIELLDQRNPQPTVVPDVRTREGIRLRWFEEHRSNLENSGPLSRTPHFQDALLANWNPRASYAVRSPWENIAGTLPVTGGGGGPWFFGAYTRDLYDQAVSWDEQAPIASGRRFYGNPFGPPQEGTGRYILFDVPRTGTGVISLAQLQHVKLSELIWHPSYAIGNSLADPRLGSGNFKGLHRSAAVADNSSAARVGGFHEDLLGWSTDTQRAKSRDEWATTARSLLGNVASSDNLVYDLSFEVNHTLWDRFFLSTGSAADKATFLADPLRKPLPNARLRLSPWSTETPTAESLGDFHQAAYHLVLDGAFNVNSARVEAWKALLASSRPTGFAGGENVSFPRVLDPPEGAWTSSDPTDDPAVWTGRRELTPDEIHRLAVAITREVKRRGPFLSLADFVNRRLAEDETGRMGALEAAIEQAGLNQTLATAMPLDNSKSLRDYSHPDRISDSTRMEQTLKPSSTAWGAPAWITQADVLQTLGPALSARSDTFAIRAYGDAVDASGKIMARAWCEAVVQRTPSAIEPDSSGINPDLTKPTGRFGRRFVIQSFRWLDPTEALQ
jgi:hypothetical protein